MDTVKQFRELLPELRALKIKTIVAIYNGGGDEGFCESADFFSDEHTPLSVSSELEVKICDIAFDASSDHAGGWWNNEGGYGEVHFDIDKETITVKHNDYVQESVYSESTYS